MIEQIGRYEIREEFGIGGMGVVYRAYDPGLDREVALKLLASHLHGDHSFNRRFEREARIVARLRHPQIVPVYDVGIHNERPYLVMAFLGGGTLRDRLESGSLTPDILWPALQQVAAGLDYANSKNVIHRDVKPTNILFDTQGNAHISDFGIAKSGDATSQLTGANLLGTPAYMSPEQFRGSDLTPESDQYSLAIVVFEALTGALPFKGDTLQVMYKHVHEPPPNLHSVNPSLPSDLSAVLAKAMAKKPADRFKNITGFINEATIAANSSGNKPLPPSMIGEPKTPADLISTAAAVRVLQSDEEPDEKVVVEQLVPTYVDSLPSGAGDSNIVPPVQQTKETEGTMQPVSPPPKATKTDGIVQGAGGELSTSSSRTRWLLPLILFLMIGAFLVTLAIWNGREVPVVAGSSPTITATAVVAQTAIPTETAASSATPDHEIAVSASGGGGSWQAGDLSGELAPGEALPVRPGTPLYLSAGDDRLILSLPRGRELILQANGEVEFHDQDQLGDEIDLLIKLRAGRLLLLSEEPTHIENPFGALAKLDEGVVGVSNSRQEIRFEVDCLIGSCEVHGDLGGSEILSSGEFAQVGGSGHPSAMMPARFELYTGMNDAVPTPTSTPTPTDTPSPTSTPTSTPTITPSNTPRPFIPSVTPTPSPDSDGDGIPDFADACPDGAGPVENKGCPLSDGGSGGGGGSGGNGSSGGSGSPPGGATPQPPPPGTKVPPTPKS